MNYGGSEGEIIRPPEMVVPATPLPRQLSIYSLTFEEFQNTMGFPDKDFGSMNMDELIRNIWSVEESQTMASTSGTAVASSGGSCVGPPLQRQSSLTLPRTISQKTVDEVWRNLAVEPEPNCLSFHHHHHHHHHQQQQQQQRQPTLAEITLEEFLLRAGVVREDLNQSGSVDDNSDSIFGDLPDSKSNVGFGLGFLPMNGNNGSVAPNSIPDNSAISIGATATAVGSCLTSLPLGNPVDLASPRGLGNPVNLARPLGMRTGGIFGIGDTTMNNGLIPTVGGSPRNQIPPDGFVKRDMDLSSLAPVPYMLSEVMRGKKRSGTVEKVVERRQKRMIKNRESAARSRARKQAYTMELEAEVAKLKEQNEELQKKQEEYVETQKTQVLEMINQQYGAKKLCLRRAHTGPW